MSFKNLSKILHAERGSKSIKFAEAVVIEYSAELFDEVIKEIDDIKDSAWPDKGFSYNLVDTKRINNGGIKLFVNTVDYVIKNNNINMDFWVNSKLSKDMKMLIDEIQEHIDKKNNRSIRVRPVEENKMNRFLLLNWFSGICFVLLGSTNLIRDQNIKTTWFEGLNMVQLIGGIMIFIALLPYAIKHLNKWLPFKNNSRDR